MKSLLLTLTIFSFCFGIKAQTNAETEVKNTIEQLFAGMSKKDSSMISSTMHPNVRMQTVSYGADGSTKITDGSATDFKKQIATLPSNIKIEERILSYGIKVDGSLAQVWTTYQFYVNDKLSHCGVNAFQLFKTDKQWKIIQVSDTRRKTGCE
jgi:hypothetical protein